MSRYLVTGGAGFIGSHICELLVREGHEVLVSDNLTTGSLDNLKHIGFKPGKGGVNYVGASCNLFELSGKLDGIFHLGMPSSIPPYSSDRYIIIDVIEYFVHLLDYCKETGRCKIVFASTSNIYNGNPLPWEETMKLVPMDFYADTRYYLERIASVYNKFYNTRCIALRLFANYGLREEYKESWASMVSQLVWAREQGKIFKIYGDGTQSRDYINAKDTARAFLMAMESPLDYSVLNVGSGTATSFNELISMIGTKVEYIDNPVKNYVKSTRANITRAVALLGFKSEISLREGIVELK